MDNGEKQQLLNKVNTLIVTISEIYSNIKGNNTEVDKFCQEWENDEELNLVMISARTFINYDNYLYTYRNSENPDGIRNPKCKEAYLSMSSLDRELAIAIIRLTFFINMPFDSTHGYGDKCEQQLKELDEEVAKWNQA
jgi:hypothetical protein